MKKVIKTFMMAVACGGLFPAVATAQSYQLVTEASQLESGKRYLIVAQHSSDYYAWNGLDTENSKGKVTASSNNVSDLYGTAVPVLLVKSGEQWKIIDTETEQCVGVQSASSQKLVGAVLPASDKFFWTITIDGGSATVKNTGYNARYLKYDYNAYGGNYSFFGAYGVNEQTDIALYKEMGSSLILYNGIDNSDAIKAVADAGNKVNVTLQNRRLFKDGNWNTLCLPFNATLTGDLANAKLMELDTEETYENKKTGFDATSGTLYLYFKEATSIEAGKPYIVKWETTGDPINNPTFNGVTITSTTPVTVSATNSGLKKVQFIGTYGPASLTANDKSKLFVGEANALYYPSADLNINACRAYFHVDLSGQTNIRAFILNFGEDIATDIVSLPKSTDLEDGWFTLDGVKLSGKPRQRGLYLNNGKKIVIP